MTDVPFIEVVRDKNTDIVRRLAALVCHLKDLDSGSGEATMLSEAILEIGYLRTKLVSGIA